MAFGGLKSGKVEEDDEKHLAKHRDKVPKRLQIQTAVLVDDAAPAFYRVTEDFFYNATRHSSL